MKVTLIVSMMVATAIAGLAPQATDQPFLVHVDANCSVQEWSSPIATCHGWSAPSGHSYGFSGTAMMVSLDSASGKLGVLRKMPNGYDRWMRLCKKPECVEYLMGAVKMPNGPFHVVDGAISGKRVRADDGNKTRIGQPGGPLALIVKFKRTISTGNATPDNEYSFGLVGRITY